MFNPDGARLEQWGEVQSKHADPESTGFVENWYSSMDLTIKQYLPFSSQHNVLPDDTFFGTNRKQQRTRKLQSLVKDGTIPQEIYDQHSQRMRGGVKTNWNAISKWSNENLKNDIETFETDEEYKERRNESLRKDREYVEEIQSRATGMGMVGQFAGSMNAMVVDPITLVTLPLAAPAVGVARTSRALYTFSTAWRTAALNTGIQIPMEAFVYDWNEQIDSDYTLQDALINIAATGVLSGSIGGVAANIGHRFSGNFRGEFGDFLSKDRDSLYESFKKLGLDDESADAAAGHQYEMNNAVDDPVVEVTKDLQQQKKNNPEIVHTPEEKAIIKEGKAKVAAEAKLNKIEADAVVKKEVAAAEKKIATAKKPKKVVTKKTEAETTGEKKLRQSQNKIDATAKKLVASEKKLATAQKKFDAAAEGTDQKVVTGKLLARATTETEKARTLAQKAKDNFTDVEAEVGTLKKTKKAPVEDNKATIADAKEKIDWEFIEDHHEITAAQKAGLITKKQEALLLDEYFKKEGGIEKTIKAETKVDPEPEPQKSKDFVEELEEHQETLNSRGKEVDDVEPVIKTDDEADVVDNLYDDLPDDLEYFVEGTPVRAKDLIDEYDDDLGELDEVMECLING